MKNKIALTIEEMENLQSLGLDTSNASMEWQKNDFGISVVQRGKGMHSTIEYVPAFNLTDVLNQLPPYHITKYDNNDNKVSIRTKYHTEYGNSLIDTAYNLLVWILEN